MNISPEQWPQAKAIALKAMELPPSERTRFVSQSCSDDPQIMASVTALLAADVRVRIEPKLWEPVHGPTAAWVLPDATASGLVGRRIGRYTITRLLGMGGMGAVYEARQEGLSRPVALKVLRAALISSETRARFQREGHLLARLEHPGIARVYDAGIHESEFGPIPYFVMELIADAMPITAFATRFGLSVRERVSLFLDVCDAVHYGHQRGVIHRDLKPSNILLGRTGSDSAPVDPDETSSGALAAFAVKVIDLGVARSTDVDIPLPTLETAHGTLMGTLIYMSPEQCARDPEDLDTRSDVYSLGVVLYELLTGRLPYDVLHKSMPEVARIIQEQRPDRPTAAGPDIAGDLSVILLKCLSKDRDERYDSATALASDLRCWLDALPIAARPASRMYQAKMFARRHRPLVVGVATAIAAVLIGLAVTSLSLHSAVLERDRARAAERSAREISAFLQDALRTRFISHSGDLLSDSRFNPIASRGSTSHWSNATRTVSFSEFIVNVRKGLDAGGIPDKALEAELRLITLELLVTSIQSTRDSGMLLEAGRAEFRRTAEILGITHPQVLSTALAMASAMRGFGMPERAVELLRPSYDAACGEFGPADLRSLELGRFIVSSLSESDDGKHQAIVLADDLVRVSSAAHGAQSPATLACRLSRCGAYSYLGDQSQSASEAREVLATLGPGVPDTDSLTFSALTFSALDLPRVPATRETLLRLAAHNDRVLRAVSSATGGEPRALFSVMNNHLEVLLQLGDFPRAIEVARQVAVGAQRSYGQGDAITIKSQNRLARLLLWEGRDLDEALRLALLADADGVPDGGEPYFDDYFILDRATVFDVRRARGEPLVALEGVDELIRGFHAKVRPGDLSWLGGYLHGIAAQALEQLGRIEEARDRWGESWKEIEEHQGPTTVTRTMTARLGAGFFDRHGPPDLARVWRERLERITVRPAIEDHSVPP